MTGAPERVGLSHGGLEGCSHRQIPFLGDGLVKLRSAFGLVKPLAADKSRLCKALTARMQAPRRLRLSVSILVAVVVVLVIGLGLGNAIWIALVITAVVEFTLEAVWVKNHPR